MPIMEPGLLYPGQTVKILVDFIDENGELADPFEVKFRVKSPYGRETGYTYGQNNEVTRLALGRFQFLTPDSLINEGGRWSWRIETKGTVTVMEGNVLVQYSPFLDGIRDAYTP